VVRYGAHAFVWIGEWTTDAGNHAIAEAGKIGFDLIEIPLIKPDIFDAASHRAALKQAGISAACSLALPRSAHLPEYPEEARRFLALALEKVEAVGSQYLGGCIAYTLGALTGKPPTKEERQTVIDVLKDVCADAKARGITLALEPCNRYETYMYNTLADVRDAIRAIGADNLRLHADTYHMNIEEEGFYKPFVETADVLDYVHMSESHRGMVGTGTVNWEEVWRGLIGAKFTGTLTLESFAAYNPDLAAATCLWRPPNESSDTMAREGLAFLKAGAERHGLLM
jgi:D-psicose/D-tagatose/L-ribulose 3-epimerase